MIDLPDISPTPGSAAAAATSRLAGMLLSSEKHHATQCRNITRISVSITDGKVVVHLLLLLRRRRRRRRPSS